MAFLEAAGVSILGEVPDGTAERVYRVLCPWWGEHTGGNRSGTRVGQYPDGALWFRCEHAHCAHRSWADLRTLAGPPQAFKRRGAVCLKPPMSGTGLTGKAVIGLG